MSKFPENMEFKDKLGDLHIPPPSKGWEGVTSAMPNGSGEFGDLGDINSPPPSHVWSNIAEILDPNRKRRLAYWWWSGVAAATLIGVILTFDFSTDNLEYSYRGLLMDKESETCIDITTEDSRSLVVESKEAKRGKILGKSSRNSKMIISKWNNRSNGIAINKRNVWSRIPNFNNSTEGVTESEADYNIRIRKEQKNEISAIAFFEPRKAIISPSTSLMGLRKDAFFESPPIQKVKPVSETMLAANFGAMGRSNNPVSTNSVYSLEASSDGTSYVGTGAGTNTTNTTNTTPPQTVNPVVSSDISQTLDYSESLPITFGMDLRKTFKKNWFLSSGIFYSGTTGKLRYTVQSEEELFKVKDHYIGIPISIGLNFLDRRRFHLFSSVSHLNEALLVRTEINSHPENSKNTNFGFNPQFGVGANFGMLFKLKNNWGVSVGLSAKSYYKAPQNSYWTSQKIWPSASISVVYNFTKKELFD